jgi:hypothetical protein
VKFAGYDMQNITIKGEVMKNEAAAQTATEPASAPVQAVVAEPVKEEMIDTKNTKAAAPSKTNPTKKASPSKTTNLNKKP